LSEDKLRISDCFSSQPLHRVIVNAVVLVDERVLLYFNNKGYWDLPGGELQKRTQPSFFIARELFVDLNLNLTSLGLLDCWSHRMRYSEDTLVLTYLFKSCSGEYKKIKSGFSYELFSEKEVEGLVMPEGIKLSIRKGVSQCAFN